MKKLTPQQQNQQQICRIAWNFARKFKKDIVIFDVFGEFYYGLNSVMPALDFGQVALIHGKTGMILFYGHQVKDLIV